MFELKLNRDMALGNGTRRRGDVLALVEGVEPEELQEAAFHLVGHDLSGLPGEIEKSEGVESIEILTVLRNSHLCHFEAVRQPTRDDDNNEDLPKATPPKRSRSTRTATPKVGTRKPAPKSDATPTDASASTSE